MVSFGEKAKIKKVGNLNYGRSYVITTVKQNPITLFSTCNNLTTISKLRAQFEQRCSKEALNIYLCQS